MGIAGQSLSRDFLVHSLFHCQCLGMAEFCTASPPRGMGHSRALLGFADRVQFMVDVVGGLRLGSSILGSSCSLFSFMAGAMGGRTRTQWRTIGRVSAAL